MSDLTRELNASLVLAGVKDVAPTREPELIAAERALSMPGQLARSSSLAHLAAALAKAQGVIQHAAKDSKNPHFASKYADLASVADACRGALAANEIAVVQSPSADGNLVRMTTLLLHSSGEWLESDPLQVQARDAGPQSIGSCLTYLRRYQLSAMVGVSPADDDAEAATDHGKAKQPVQATRMPQEPRSEPARVNVQTGEEAPAKSLPPAPVGYAYIEQVFPRGPWTHVVIAGVPMRTKLPVIARTAREAFDEGVPVKFQAKPDERGTEAAWLNRIEKWTAEAAQHEMPVDADEIPFGG